MANTEDQLKKVLYRAFCPDSTELGEFFLGIIPREREAIIQSHLKECPHCTRELAQLKTFLQENSQEAELSLVERARQRVRILVAHLMDARSSPGLSPATQGVRGQEEKVFSYDAEGYQVILDIQADNERPDRKAINGLVIGLETRQEEYRQLEARLMQEGELVSTAAVDEFGNFRLDSLVPGQYNLVLFGPGIEIHIESLTLE